MAEEGMRSHEAARDKAARRLGVANRREWPTNAQIEEALLEYQRLFRRPEDDAALDTLRRHAAQAMRMLERFSPRLVGRVLDGSADVHTAVTLHLFADAAEEVGFALTDRGIPHRLGSARVIDPRRGPQSRPCFRFVAGSADIELVVFPLLGLRTAPQDPVDGRSMARAGLAQVEAMLGDSRPGG
ncbi:MAG: hypothetical protein AB7Q97_24095 [Gammaproteobacteria bacterium]